MLSIEQAKERVERGARLLDKRKPGWQDRIDLARLSVASADFCILGQLYAGHYTAQT